MPLTLLKDDYILEGRIDLIRGQGETLEILDFKTDKKPDVNSEKDREKLVRYKRQLEIYAHLVEKKYGKSVGKMHLFYTGTEEGSPFVSYGFNAEAVDGTIAEIGSVVDKIEQKKFTRNGKCTPAQCAECDFKFYCGKNV